jgi:hypothetical protein
MLRGIPSFKFPFNICICNKVFCVVYDPSNFFLEYVKFWYGVLTLFL